jgi:hypothetical protein
MQDLFAKALNFSRFPIQIYPFTALDPANLKNRVFKVSLITFLIIVQAE